MLRRRSLLALWLLPLSAFTVLRAQRARAIPVFDSAGVLQVAAQVLATIDHIEQTRRQVEYLRNAARRLDPRSYRTIGALLDGDAVTFDSITRDLRTIGYTLQGVDRQYRRIFPDENAVRNMRPAEHADATRQMNRELYGAALASHRAQSSVSNLEASHAESRAILERSGAESSQVAQIQSAIQMLALVHENLTNITQTVAAAGRVSSDIAAAGVTDNRIARERQQRYTEDFDRPSNSNGIDPSFLGG